MDKRTVRNIHTILSSKDSNVALKGSERHTHIHTYTHIHTHRHRHRHTHTTHTHRERERERERREGERKSRPFFLPKIVM